MLELVVRGDLKLSNKSEQLVLELTLEEYTLLKLVIFSASVVFSIAPLRRKGKQFFVTEVEQDFIRYFPIFDLDFVLNFELLINEVENKVFDLVDRNHTRSIRIVLFPKPLESFESFILNLLLLIEKFALETF